MVVVIPCLAEAGIWNTIESLRKNRGYQNQVCCMVVVNHSESESEEKKKTNIELLDQFKNRPPQLHSTLLHFEVVKAFDLPGKKAGVGMARKLGMDKAVEKFKQQNAFNDGVIVCLDGDCTVSENYLQEIERYFDTTGANGCSIYFEHSLESENADAITDYELFLRYYNNALRWSGFPFAFQTVGSSMAVSAKAYTRQGGMNTRKAGEDFYFLNKIIQLEKFGDLTSTTVFPSARKSDRVPFGTGREMIEWETSRQLLAYSPELINQLKKIIFHVDDFRDAPDPISLLKSKLDNSVYDYLVNLGFNKNIREIKTHTASLPAFRKRFFVWMNAFQIMKMLNELSLNVFPKNPIFNCASWLWTQISNQSPDIHSKGLLIQFREFDGRNAKWLE